MKVIFLDFDGVINNYKYFNGIDEKCVKILKIIQKETNSSIVAITSLKYSFQIDDNIEIKNTNYYKIVEQLRKQNIEISDITPLVNHNKKLEILAYLKQHNEIEQFVILDDYYICDELKEHQVLIDLYNGLQEEHIKPTINILNGNLGFYPKEYNQDETPEEKNIRINTYHQKRK